jgi:hypothetical protein
MSSSKPPSSTPKPKSVIVNSSGSSLAGSVSTAGRRLGKEAAKVAMHETLSRISETGESKLSKGTAPPPPPPKNFADQAKETCKTIMGSKVAVSGVVFLLTFVVLCALNPPMAQESTDNYTDPPKRSAKKIIVWSSLTALLALVLPYGSCLVKKT